MNFAIIAHPDKYIVAPPLKTVLNWCLNNHTGCFAKKSLFKIGEVEPDNTFVAVGSDQEAVNRADMIIAIGGDGTILHAAQLTIENNTPVLGINCGRLGFMANIQQENIDESLQAVKSGEFRIDKRTMLEASVNNSKPYFALNEFLFTKKDTTTLVTLTVRYDGYFVNRYWSDGLIVASPTGSTAYNLSTGGPIVMPGTPVMVLTPINPHTLTTRPLVLPFDKTLTVQVEENAKHVLFSNDGRIMENHNDTLEVDISCSSHSVHLIQMENQNYFETLRTKLMWGMDTRKKN